jgi:hypothetical protein
MEANDDAKNLEPRGALGFSRASSLLQKLRYSDLRIFSTIAVVELFSTSPSTFTVPP